MYIGNVLTSNSTSRTSAIIHITDGQTDRILGDITEKQIIDNVHRKSLKDNLETFDFTTLADQPFSQYLGKHNRVIIPNEDNGFSEFVILDSGKYRNESGMRTEVFSSASYLLLKKAKIIEPQTFSEQTTSTVVSHTLGGTEWQAGTITAAGIRTFHIEEHTNPFAFLRRIAQEFNLELHFRVEVDGNRIRGRYVDLLPRVGQWRGREVEFGRDLVGIERIEKTGNIFTALVGLGPVREDGTRLEVLVEDLEALARWGKNGQHFIETYEPQTSDEDMSLERLTTLTENELEKRVNEVVEYTADIADLENVPGMENKKIRFGDTIKIKDTKFNPPLYLEARVHTQERDIVNIGRKIVELGDFIEYTEDEVTAVWKSLQSEIRQKISMMDVLEVTYTKQTIDEKDTGVFNDGTYYADGVAQTAENNAKGHAETVANQAEQNAKEHAETAADQAEQNAKEYAEKRVYKQDTPPSFPELNDLWIDTSSSLEILYRWNGSKWKNLAPTNAAEIDAVAKSEYDSMVQELQSNISEKANVEWVNGQLHLKANLDDTYTKVETDSMLTDKADKVSTYTKTEVDQAVNSRVSTTTYAIDQNNVVLRFEDAESRIGQTEYDISQRVALTLYEQDMQSVNDATETLARRMEQAETDISQNAYEISQKVSLTIFEEEIESINDENSSLKSRLEAAESDISQNAYEILQKVSLSIYEQEINGSNGLKSRLEEAESEISQNAYDITQRVTLLTYNQDINDSTNGLKARMTEAESEIIQNAEEIAQRITRIEYDADQEGIMSRLETAESELLQTVDSIALRVTREEFDNLAIGGTNVFRGSFLGSGVFSTGSNANVTYSVENDENILKALSNGQGSFFGVTSSPSYRNSELKSGVRYTVSFEIRGNITALDYIYFMRLDGSNISIPGKTGLNLSETEFTKLVFHHTLPWKTSQGYLLIGSRDHSAGKWFEVRRVKIEEGDKATTWSPNPLDVQERGEEYTDNVVTPISVRLTTAESTILTLSDEIDLRVTKDDIVASINLSPETISISAEKLNLEGAVTFTSFNPEVQEAINEGRDAKSTVSDWAWQNTVEIDGGKIRANTIDVNKLNVTELSAITANLGTVEAGTIKGVEIEGVNISGSKFVTSLTTNGRTQRTTIENGEFLNEDLMSPDYTGSIEARIRNGAVTVTSDYVHMGVPHFSRARMFSTHISLERNNAQLAMNEDGLRYSSPNLTVTSLLFNQEYIRHNRKMVTSGQETGYFGMGARQTDNTSLTIAGVGVNFRSEKTYTPSSVAIWTESRVGGVEDPLISNITNQGFYAYIQGTGSSTGTKAWRGHYTA